MSPEEAERYLIDVTERAGAYESTRLGFTHELAVDIPKLVALVRELQQEPRKLSARELIEVTDRAVSIRALQLQADLDQARRGLELLRNAYWAARAKWGFDNDRSDGVCDAVDLHEWVAGDMDEILQNEAELKAERDAALAEVEKLRGLALDEIAGKP